MKSGSFPLSHSISGGMILLTAALTTALVVLALRSCTRCDEFGYYSYDSSGSLRGLDSRNIFGSYRGAIFWVSAKFDLPARSADEPTQPTVDWYGGDPNEFLASSAPSPVLASDTLPAPFQARASWPAFYFASVNGDTGVRIGRCARRTVVIPDWCMLLIFAFLPVVALKRLCVRYRRQVKRLCIHCGYDLRGGDARCPECGHVKESKEGGKAFARRAVGLRFLPIAIIIFVAIGSFFRIFCMQPPPQQPVRLEPGAPIPFQHMPAHIELGLANDVSVRFALIPSGKFLMGSPSGEAGRLLEEVQHSVTITSSFYMSTLAVTQDQYTALMKTNPSHFRGGDRPVEMVTWEEASEFCRLMSLRVGRNISLPTEAQWEYACRAGSVTPFNTGAKLPRNSANYARIASYPSNRGNLFPLASTIAAGSFSSNRWGLFDMHGNVSQWCSDRYDEYSSRDANDPVGPKTGRARVLRGGSWSDVPLFCRSAFRKAAWPDDRDYRYGFRLVLDYSDAK